MEKWWRDVKGTEIKSASPLFSSWRRHREDKSGGEDGSRREMETLGIRRPGKIPSTIRTFNRASRGKEGGESWMATLNRASSRRRTARMHLSLSFSSLLLRHLSAISSFPRFLPPLRLSAQRQTNYLRSRISIISGRCLLLKMIFRKFEIEIAFLASRDSLITESRASGKFRQNETLE